MVALRVPLRHGNLHAGHATALQRHLEAHQLVAAEGVHGHRVADAVAREQLVQVGRVAVHAQAIDGDQDVARRQAGLVRRAAFVHLGQLGAAGVAADAGVQRRLAALALVDAP